MLKSGVLLNSERNIQRRSKQLTLLSKMTPCLPKHKSTIVLLYNNNKMYAMHFLPFWTIKPIDVTDGSCEITWCYDVTSRKPCNITSCRMLCKTMRHVDILMALDGHMSKSEDAYL